jgi:hypothetical protein
MISFNPSMCIRHFSKSPIICCQWCKLQQTCSQGRRANTNIVACKKNKGCDSSIRTCSLSVTNLGIDETERTSVMSDDLGRGFLSLSLVDKIEVRLCACEELVKGGSFDYANFYPYQTKCYHSKGRHWARVRPVDCKTGQYGVS